MDIHDWHARNLPQSPPQIFIHRSNDVTAMGSHDVDNFIISVVPISGETHEARVFGQPQCHSELGTELLQLGNDCIRNAWDAFCQQAVHHASHDIQLVFDGEIEEVGIHNDMVWRPQLGVVGEPQSRLRFGSAMEQQLYHTNKQKGTFLRSIAVPHDAHSRPIHARKMIASP